VKGVAKEKVVLGREIENQEVRKEKRFGVRVKGGNSGRASGKWERNPVGLKIPIDRQRGLERTAQ